MFPLTCAWEQEMERQGDSEQMGGKASQVNQNLAHLQKNLQKNECEAAVDL